MTELREKVADAIREHIDQDAAWGFDECAGAILAIPEIAEALAEKAEADEAVRGGGYYLRSNRELVVSEQALPDNQS